VAVKQANLMATSFHPEITVDTRWHVLFLEMAGKCAPYAGVKEADKEEAQRTEIKLVSPGQLPVFTDSVFAGAAGKM